MFPSDLFPCGPPQRYVTAGEHVPVNGSVAKVFFPQQAGAQYVEIEIWSTRATDIARVTEPGAELEVAMIIGLGQVAQKQKRGVKVEFFFGDTAARWSPRPINGAAYEEHGGGVRGFAACAMSDVPALRALRRLVHESTGRVVPTKLRRLFQAVTLRSDGRGLVCVKLCRFLRVPLYLM